MAITGRMHTEADVDNLVQFWCENSDWDQIDRTEWERRFYSTPFGRAAVAIAEDSRTGEINGQIVFIPTEISVDGRTVKAFRPYALVIKKSYRSGLKFLGLIDIISKMYKKAMEEFRNNGVTIMHMMPDPRWARAFKFLPNMQSGHFPLWCLSLPLPEKFIIEDSFTLQPVTATHEQIDSLWEKNKMLYGCNLVRNTSSLPWKCSHGDYRLTGVFRNEELVGFSASVIKEKDKQWLICDMITADSDASLIATLQATCNAAVDFCSSQQTEINKVSILATSVIEKMIEKMGFQKDSYRFPIVVQHLNNDLPKEMISPERWYVSAND